MAMLAERTNSKTAAPIILASLATFASKEVRDWLSLRVPGCSVSMTIDCG